MAWICYYGIPLHIWNLEFFSSLAQRWDEKLSNLSSHNLLPSFIEDSVRSIGKGSSENNAKTARELVEGKREVHETVPQAHFLAVPNFGITKKNSGERLLQYRIMTSETQQIGGAMKIQKVMMWRRRT
ncbi:hypothetical protein Ancab_013135, partial [Ancistrocladus abbreviatus]